MSRFRKWALFGLLIAVVASASYWGWANGPIRTHNRILRTAIDSAERLEISNVAEIMRDGTFGPTQAHIITDRSEVAAILSDFRLRWYMMDTKEMHACAGHIELRIIMPGGTEHLLAYDHGHAIYPITRGEDFAGFTDLPKEATRRLNRRLLALGFSEREIGLPEANKSR